MINANLEQFLDSGWYSGATLYYEGYTYVCEGWYENADNNNPMHLVVYKYKSIICEEKYTKVVCDGENTVDFEYIIDKDFKTSAEAKQKFLTSKIFDGKSFWEVESRIAWYDEIGNIDISNL